MLFKTCLLKFVMCHNLLCYWLLGVAAVSVGHHHAILALHLHAVLALLLRVLTEGKSISFHYFLTHLPFARAYAFLLHCIDRFHHGGTVENDHIPVHPSIMVRGAEAQKITQGSNLTGKDLHPSASNIEREYIQMHVLGFSPLICC